MTGTVRINGVERPAVDEASLRLAKHFLGDEPNATEDNEWDLAGAIQQVVEDWFVLATNLSNGPESR